jgi:hypothetical protein
VRRRRCAFLGAFSLVLCVPGSNFTVIRSLVVRSFSVEPLATLVVPSATQFSVCLFGLSCRVFGGTLLAAIKQQSAPQETCRDVPSSHVDLNSLEFQVSAVERSTLTFIICQCLSSIESTPTFYSQSTDTRTFPGRKCAALPGSCCFREICGRGKVKPPQHLKKLGTMNHHSFSCKLFSQGHWPCLFRDRIQFQAVRYDVVVIYRVTLFSIFWA